MSSFCMSVQKERNQEGLLFEVDTIKIEQGEQMFLSYFVKHADTADMAVLFVQIGCTDLSLKYAQPHRFAEPIDVLWLCLN